MSFRSCSLNGLYALRWGALPEVRDVETYATQIAEAHASQGTPLVGLFIMPQDSGAPDDLFRKAQARKLPQIMHHLQFAVAVFEGQGFFSSVKRSALVAILLLSPGRQPVYVRATVEDALLKDPPGPIHFDARIAIGELRKRGLCS
jgi:hypothetical protein